MSLPIRLTDAADFAIRDEIERLLGEFNTQCTGMSDHRPLVLSIEDANARVVGGLWGHTGFGWLFVELLFVPESMRGKGIGAELMSRAEGEAAARGCHSAWLDTFAFQARGFYERLGYGCFGELQDYPVGFSRYFMKKRLTRSMSSG
jgi:GNAT superfamily N-acetyltransferase